MTRLGAKRIGRFTLDEFDTIVAALVEKHRLLKFAFPRPDEDDDEYLTAAIGAVVADTLLLVDGAIVVRDGHLDLP